jgi:Ca-activated chloride channel family protein
MKSTIHEHQKNNFKILSKTIKKICLMIVMVITTQLFAQEKTITGTISDKSSPISGCNVVVKGTSNSQLSDVNGNYSINAKLGDILVYSYIGYETKSITVGSSNVINVILIESTKMLDEVLPIANKNNNYKNTAVIIDDNARAIGDNSNSSLSSKNGTVLNEVVVVGAMGIKRKKNSLTSAQQQISRKELTQASNPSIAQSLAGKVSGLQINSTSNGVNAENRIVLRGSRSISGNNQALIVIDNAISSLEMLNLLPPEAVDNINVIKGTQGAALYGEQGANGVIVVSTKKGNTVSGSNIIPEEVKPNNAKQTKIEVDQDEYESFIENQFESPKFSPLSTFSIDVDNASYSNVRNFINNGQTVPKDAIRVEEMVNYFKYDYKQPQDEHPFSIQTEYSDCPWNSKNKLVKIGIQGKEIETSKLPPLNLVFLIDVSGSMSDANKLPLLKQSLKILVEQMRKEDKISIVVYAGAAGLVLPATSGEEKKAIIRALDNLNAGGSTAGGAGIELAYKIAQENFVKGGNNRVVLATDGDFNVGASSNTDMQTLIEEKRKSGVFLTCLGYGMGNYQDSKMEILADKGNGNYAYIDNLQEANRFLGKEFKGSMYAIAKDVKIQIEFNPTQVESYRLIGYENRKLRSEDFKNDAIDAGELGSGHTVTAFYEITPKGAKNEYYEEPSDLKYTKTEATGTVYKDELATIKFRYKKPDGDKSIEMATTIPNNSNSLDSASEDFKFGTAVAWFGLKLRDSKLIKNKSSKDIIELAKKGQSNDNEGYKTEFIRLVGLIK